MAYEWRAGFWQGQGANLATAPGYNGTPFSPGAVGAPSSAYKLAKVGLFLAYHVTGTNPSVLISPDWPMAQSGYVCAAAQAAGDATVPSPTNPFPVDYKVNEALTLTPVSFGFTTTQGSALLQTQGIIWSKGEDRSPPGGGLQVRVGWSLNDATAGLPVFGSASRWRYTCELRVLWTT